MNMLIKWAPLFAMQLWNFTKCVLYYGPYEQLCHPASANQPFQQVYRATSICRLVAMQLQHLTNIPIMGHTGSFVAMQLWNLLTFFFLEQVYSATGICIFVLHNVTNMYIYEKASHATVGPES